MNQIDELNDQLYEFITNGPEESRPFAEFTSWEWDTVKVVNLETLDATEVKAMTGEDIDVPVSQSGLFVCYLDGKRVRAELLDVHQFAPAATPEMLSSTGCTPADCEIGTCRSFWVSSTAAVAVITRLSGWGLKGRT